MRSLLGALVVSLFVVLPASAQETRGTILGTVQDATGVMPGATVKITNLDTKVTQQLVTNSPGYFEAPLLQPGNYSVSVEMPGFKTTTRSGVMLAVGQQASLAFTLEVGQTMMLNAGPDSKIELRCRGVPLLTGRMGRVGSSVAVRVDEAIERTDESRHQ